MFTPGLCPAGGLAKQVVQASTAVWLIFEWNSRWVLKIAGPPIFVFKTKRRPLRKTHTELIGPPPLQVGHVSAKQNELADLMIP